MNTPHHPVPLAPSILAAGKRPSDWRDDVVRADSGPWQYIERTAVRYWPFGDTPQAFVERGRSRFEIYCVPPNGAWVPVNFAVIRMTYMPEGVRNADIGRLMRRHADAPGDEETAWDLALAIAYAAKMVPADTRLRYYELDQLIGYDPLGVKVIEAWRLADVEDDWRHRQ